MVNLTGDLVTNIRNTGAEKSTREINTYGGSVRNAEGQTMRLGTATRRTSDRMQTFTRNTDSATRATGSLSTGSFVATGVLVGMGAALFRIGSNASTAAFEFDKLVAEITTLGGRGGIGDFEEAEERILRITALYGGALADNSRAFYDSRSAGARNLAEAEEEVATSAELATVTSTTLAQSLNAIIPIVNVVGRELISASMASDILAVSIFNGRTRLPEFGKALEEVLPIAIALGISAEETAAVLSALTTVVSNAHRWHSVAVVPHCLTCSVRRGGYNSGSAWA